MDYLEIAPLLAGFVRLVLGYRHNPRSWLVAPALLLFLSGNAGTFLRSISGSWSSVGDPVASAAH